nr:OmpA family protein [Woodsholea maritima]
MTTLLRSMIAIVMTLVVTAACTTTDQYGNTYANNTGRGALIGAAAGGLLGYLTNTNDSEEGRTNALIGAGIGALAGAGIGNYMDRQERAFRERLRGSGVGVRREGQNLYLVMPGDITFDTNESRIKPQFVPVLNDVADVLQTFPATYVDVVGHADSTGAADYNQALSERRATSVASYLIGQGVIRDRFFVAGMGESAPIASNDSPQGRSQNRRVEIKIAPHTAS